VQNVSCGGREILVRLSACPMSNSDTAWTLNPFPQEFLRADLLSLIVSEPQGEKRTVFLGLGRPLVSKVVRREASAAAGPTTGEGFAYGSRCGRNDGSISVIATLIDSRVIADPCLRARNLALATTASIVAI